VNRVSPYFFLDPYQFYSPGAALGQQDAEL
jgi:hypothetical protein